MSRKFPAIDFVEVSVGEHEIDLEEIDFEQLQNNLERKGFDLVIHLPFRQPVATEVERFNDAVLEYHRQVLEEIQQHVDVEKVVVHANMRDRDSEDELEVLEDQIRKLEKIGEEKGVEICFENVRHVDTPELFELGELLRKTNSSMCFDIGHAFIEKEDEEEVLEFIEEYGDIFSHLHVHDVRNRGDSHIAVGEGQIDWEKVTGELTEFEGTACLELFTGDTDYIQLSREKFRQHL